MCGETSLDYPVTKTEQVSGSAGKRRDPGIIGEQDRETTVFHPQDPAKSQFTYPAGG